MTENPEMPDVPRDWYFTFGASQRFFAGHENDDCQGIGVSIDGCYVKIHGKFSEARAAMLKSFGRVWSFQYESLPQIPRYMGEWRDLTFLLRKGNMP